MSFSSSAGVARAVESIHSENMVLGGSGVRQLTRSSLSLAGIHDTRTNGHEEDTLGAVDGAVFCDEHV